MKLRSMGKYPVFPKEFEDYLNYQEMKTVRVVGNHDNVTGEPSTSTNSSLIFPDNDPVYSAITSKLLAGCSCSNT